MRTKGFTLIELLAVIVILAIIALIAIPMISKIIDKTEDSASLRSAELYIDGVNQAIMRANLNNKFRPKECIIQEDGNLICDGETELKIEATGSKPSAGTLEIEDRKVKSFTGMIIDIYELEMPENGKIYIKDTLDEKNEEFLSEPDLYNNSLTPIIYENNTWKVADINTKWYDYANQEWANAVILKSGVSKNVGDTVNISSEVQGMFVWIPKYEYKIEGEYGRHSDGTVGTQEQPGEIKVNFISKETITASKGYHIHPAFAFGGTELSGLWMGKFETTGTAAAPTILPNLTSLRSQSISNKFATAQKFTNSLTSADAHMSKNSEWGAVAYLSQSKYGKYGNNNYIGADKEVYINNCTNYITGIGGDTRNSNESSATCTTNTYETAKGQAASTTGNITGIYDMSGGTNEYVMGVYNKTVGGSGINFNTLDEKYYDNYIGTYETACNGDICYGHALSETNRWYIDWIEQISQTYPWIIRGDSYHNNLKAGIFAISSYIGDGLDPVDTFRVVLTNT